VLDILATLFKNRRHRTELHHLREVLGAFADLTAADDVALMIRIGTRIRTILERRFGPDSETFVHSEADLKNQDRFVEDVPLARLQALARDLSGRADKAGAEEDIAPVVSLRLVSGWLNAKAIARESTNAPLVGEARELEARYFAHVNDLLGVIRDARYFATESQK
jgi:hypothetical protein